MFHAVHIIQPIPIIMTYPNGERYVLCFVLGEECCHTSSCSIPLGPFPLPLRTV